MDIQRLIERNRSVALDLYGDKLDKDKNIVGTNYYFDECWRLRLRIDGVIKESEEANGKIKGAFLMLVNYCKDHDDCEGCIFFGKEAGCIFSCGELPSKWEIPSSV